MSVLELNKENIFGERLKNLRSVVMKKTQKEFSELLGIPQPTLSAYESGKNKPAIDVVISIAEKCNVSMDWLCGRESTSHLDSMGDLMSVFYDLYDSKEFSFKTEIHDRVDLEGDDQNDDTSRNWIRLTFYHNENRYDNSLIYSQDICNIIKTAYRHHKELINYDCSQEYYDNQKKSRIEDYSEFPITRIDMSDISEDERVEKRLAKLKAEWEEELKNQDKK